MIESTPTSHAPGSGTERTLGAAPHPTASRTPSLLIVIVTFRVPQLTIDCLHSLAEERARGQAFEVVVVENASGDDTAQRLAAAIAQHGWQDWAKLVVLDQNVGFAGGNNAAIRPALSAPSPPDYVLLLNPDTIVRPGAIQPLVDFLEQQSEVGIVGSRLEDPDGTAQRSAFRFPSVFGEFEGTVRVGPVSRLLSAWTIAPPSPSQACPTDWVCGASMLVRRAVFESIGALDDRYFMYFEEVDFCHRALKAGWSCWYLPSSRVVHLVGQSSGVTGANRMKKRRPAYWFESRRRYFVANHGRVRARLADVAWVVGQTLHSARCAVTRKPSDDPSHLLRDFLRLTFARSPQ